MASRHPHGFTVCRKCLPVLLLLAVGFVTRAQEIQLTVIGNVTGVPSEMKSSELVSVLKGEKQRWNDGTKVTIYIMKTTTPIGQSTCKKIYNWSGDKVKRYWLELSFSGKADAPTFCNTVEELESYVSQNPGAIGIVDRNSSSNGVKTILIDGKNPF
jgi:hypothetical protein